MKKFIVMIFALATILALTVIPASAFSMEKPFELDKSGETWFKLENKETNTTTYFKFEYDGDKIEEGTQVILWNYDKAASAIDKEIIEGIGSDSEKELFEQLNKVTLISFLPPTSSNFDVPVKIYVQNDGVNKLFYVDTSSASQSEIDDINFHNFTYPAKENDVKLTAPDGNEYSFSMMETNFETNYLFFSPNNPVPPHETNGAGSTFMNSSAWFIISIAELVAVVALSVVLVTKSKKVKS